MLHQMNGEWIVDSEGNPFNGAPCDGHVDSTVLAVGQHEPYILLEVYHADPNYRPHDRWTIINTATGEQRWFRDKADLVEHWSTASSDSMPPMLWPQNVD